MHAPAKLQVKPEGKVLIDLSEHHVLIEEDACSSIPVRRYVSVIAAAS